MSPAEIISALRRRWYVLLLALLLTAAGEYHVMRPTEFYQSTAVLVVKPPVTGNQPNQLTNLQPTIAAVSYGVVQQLQAPDGVAELRAAGVHGKYALLPRNSGTSATPRYLIPSLQVQSELTDPVEANRMVGLITKIYARHLQALQDAERVPAGSRMTAFVLVPPSSAREYGTKSRGLVGYALTGLFAGTASALWLDRRLTGRRRRGEVAGPAAVASAPQPA